MLKPHRIQKRNAQEATPDPVCPVEALSFWKMDMIYTILHDGTMLKRGILFSAVCHSSDDLFYFSRTISVPAITAIAHKLRPALLIVAL